MTRISKTSGKPRSGEYPLPKIFILVALDLAATHKASASPTRLVDEPPVHITTPATGVIQIDFGRVAFGNLRLTPPPGSNHKIKVHFGKALVDGRINRKPPGTVRYAMTQLDLSALVFVRWLVGRATLSAQP